MIVCEVFRTRNRDTPATVTVAENYLCNVIIEFLQRCFAVDEGVPCVLPQLHQQRFIYSQSSTARVETPQLLRHTQLQNTRHCQSSTDIHTNND